MSESYPVVCSKCQIVLTLSFAPGRDAMHTDCGGYWTLLANEKPLVPAAPKDEVNHPAHYNTGKVEVIDSIEAACAAIGPDAFKGYLTGNVIKYLSRWNKKGGVQDLKKAGWYLARLLKYMEAV